MTRRIAALLILVPVLFLLAACGSDDDEGADTTTTTSAASSSSDTTTGPETEPETTEPDTTEGTTPSSGGSTTPSPPEGEVCQLNDQLEMIFDDSADPAALVAAVAEAGPVLEDLVDALPPDVAADAERAFSALRDLADLAATLDPNDPADQDRLDQEAQALFEDPEINAAGEGFEEYIDQECGDDADSGGDAESGGVESPDGG